MILIFFSWIAMLLFFIPAGYFLKSILKIKTTNFSVIVIFGMFLETVVLSICSFFINIGVEIFFFNLIFISILYLIYSKKLKHDFLNWIVCVKEMSVFSKLILLLTSVLCLYKCALSPFLVDNESYYIQSIKWINEFGLIKGLANLHIFLAQMSPLHILQAGFNFSFLYSNFNDINGIILIVSSIFFMQKFELEFKKSNNYNWIGLLPVFNVLFFQFVSQPSPDLILILLSQIIFYLFLNNFNDNNSLKTAIILFSFIVFVKLTIAPLGLLILIWIYKKKESFLLFSISSLIITLLFISKNCVLSGYPFYPFNFYATDFDWKIPTNLFAFITESTKNAGYFENSFLESPTFYQKINAWLHLSGLNRIFNLGIILLFFLTLITTEFRFNPIFKKLYFVLLLHFLLLLCSSPQFRFFLPEFIFFSVVIISNFINYIKIHHTFCQISLILFLIGTFIFIENVHFKKFTSNKLLQTDSKFLFKNLLIPASNSKYCNLKFTKIKNENLDYYSPNENFFFFGTANGNLPCVNKVQIDYFEKYYFIKPQMRTNNIKDGFYSKIIKPINE